MKGKRNRCHILGGLIQGGIHSMQYLVLCIEECLGYVLKLEPDSTKEELSELRIYMERFLKDVESDKEVEAFEKLRKEKDLADFVLFAEEYLEQHNSSDFKEALRVIDTPPEKLPLLINNLGTESSLEIAKMRLSGEIP